MDASLRLRSVQHDKVVSFQVLFLSFRALFFVIPSESEESSMDASLRLRSVQHDKVVSFQVLFFVIPSALFCHSERSEESSMDASLRLRSVQHDRRCHSERSEESIAWMLRYAQHDRLGMANLTLPVPLLRKERDVSASPKQGEVIQHGCSLCSA